MRGGVAATRKVGALRVGDLLSALPSSGRKSSKKTPKRKDTMKGIKSTKKRRTQRKRLTAPSKKQRRVAREKRSEDAFSKLFSGLGF
jgi:hypothetical protein